jgi:hypothetical protein
MKYITGLILLAGAIVSGQSTGVQSSFSPIEVLNRQLPSWVRFSLEERVREESFTALAFQSNNDDTYVLQRFRPGLLLLPTPWLRFRFQAQDARVFFKTQKPYAPPYQDTWDLRMAYVELGNSEKGFALRVGRQEINIGDERLVGSTNWSNTARTFEAARASYRNGRFRVDAFASSVVVLKDGQLGEHAPGSNLHGVFAGLENVVPKSTFEPYVLWRLSPRVKAELGPTGTLNFFTSGFRWVGKLPENFDYAIEVAIQRGSLGPDKVQAWAGHWVTGYNLPDIRFKPRLFLEYNYATGDGNPRDGHRHTFDQLYPTGHDKYGLADQVGWKNIEHFRAAAEFKFTQKLGGAVKWNAYWLADPKDALYNTTSTAVARQADGSAGKFVGTELDATGLYSFTKAVQAGSGVGHIFPGMFLQRTTPHRSLTFQYLFVETRF